MTKRHWGVLSSCVALLLGARALGACGAADASADGAGTTPDGGSSRPEGGTPLPPYEAGPDNAALLPSLDGWARWDDYDPQCSFLVRAPGRPLPKLTWEPCGSLAGAQQNGCRHIQFDWSHPRDIGGEWITPSTGAFRREDGTVALMTSREEGGDLVRIIVEADGPVLQAFREYGSACRLYENTSSGDHFAYGVWPTDGKGGISRVGGGAIGGRLDERPRVILRFSDQSSHAYVAGGAGIVHLPKLDLHAWSDGSLIGSLLRPGDAGLFTGEFSVVGNAFLWNAGNLGVSRQNVWSPSQGTQSLLTAGDDPTHGYADLATDGVQMVWGQGARTDLANAYPRVSIVTSPYSATAAGLAPRILRSDITGYGFGTTPWVIGCGYAARSTTLEPSPGQFEILSFVVRLSDGYAWKLPDESGTKFGWRRPLAITCDEVFVLVDEKPAPGTRNFNVARMRLDALGPGIPPP